MTIKLQITLLSTFLFLAITISAYAADPYINKEHHELVQKAEEMGVQTPYGYTAHDPKNLPSADDVEDINELIYPYAKWATHLTYILDKGPQYLDKDIVIEIPEPPANDSLQTLYELYYLKRIAKLRTEKNVEDIKFQNKTLIVMGAVDGTYPVTREFIMKTFPDVSYFILREKRKFQRPRPTQLDEQLTTVLPIPKHASYPSGHSGQSFWGAYVLGKLDPAHKQKYYDYSYNIAQNREIAGVHYPSDSLAGQLMAPQLFEMFMEIPELKDLYRKAQAEWGIIEE